MTTSIERIREQVRGVRDLHQNTRPDLYVNRNGYCSACSSPKGHERWPCPTLRLAEDKLRLAEALEETTGSLRSAGYEHVCANNERILAECAEEKGESDLPAGYTRVDPADGFGG